MNRATIEERNYYAESYIVLIEVITKEIASIISDINDIRRAKSEV